MRNIIGAALLLLTTAALAQQPSPPAQPDDKNEMLARDLHAVGRVTDVAKDLNDERQVLLAIVDNDIETIREPRGDGSYKWASLQREEGGRVSDEKTVEYVSTEKELRYVTVTGSNGYRVEVTVPKKKGTFSANNRVYIRNVLVDSTGFDGKTTHQEIPVNAWVNPGDANGVALAEIGKSVKATAELGVESGNKAAVAQVAVVQAKLIDDPNSPYFPAAKRLLQIRDFIAAKTIDRGHLKNAVDEAKLALPGELEKRTSEQQRAMEERRRLMATGETKGSIATGDATPDVVNELISISTLSSGTVDQQTEARTRLQALVESLKAKP
ncbi:MAG: hypothetical protein DMF56_26760 [Acidobacteria bacterium]|nr:MAG: hypothetical protein DMF56_26760 [Acidobacteriota bacterium]